MELPSFITYEEAKELLVMKGRVKAFEGYVISSEYSIDRETAAEMLGFKLREVPDAEKSN